VLGVFELFSGRPRAFEERDLSALQRLSEMVETAVKHAVAALSVTAAEELPVESGANAVAADLAPALLGEDTPPPGAEKTSLIERTEVENAKPEPASKNPRFWSAAMQTPASTSRADEIAESIPVPVELRNLQKCKACGFPVSAGRTLCVECEEKQWRGESLPQRAANVAAGKEARPETHARPHQETQPEIPVVSMAGDAPQAPVSRDSSAQTSEVPTSEAQTSRSTPEPAGIAIVPRVAEDSTLSAPQILPENVSASDDSTLFLSSAAPSESWLATNKYILGALLVVAIVIGVVAWLR
jgi:hypothetical protein